MKCAGLHLYIRVRVLVTDTDHAQMDGSVIGL